MSCAQVTCGDGESMKGEGDRGGSGGLMWRNPHVDRLFNDTLENRVGWTDWG